MKDKTVTGEEVVAEIRKAQKAFNVSFCGSKYAARSEAFLFAYILYHFGVETVAPSVRWFCGDESIECMMIQEQSVEARPNISVAGKTRHEPLLWFLAHHFGYSLNGGAGDGYMQMNLSKTLENWNATHKWVREFNSELVITFHAMKEAGVTKLAAGKA